MGCSPDVYTSPEQLAEEKRRDRARKLIRLINLSSLTVGEMLELFGVYYPIYPMHTWNSQDTDVLVGILERLGYW